MKDIDEVYDGVLDGHYSKTLPDDDLPEGCYRFHNKHGLFAMINGYEEYARGILNTGGYPLTMKELWAMRKGLKKQIRYILDMFYWFESVRREVEKNDAKMAAFFMAHAIHSAMKARVKPMEKHIRRGIQTVQGASLGGKVAKQAAGGRHKIWQAEADIIWADKPSYTRWRVAEMIEKKYSGDLKLEGKKDTIYRVIKK